MRANILLAILLIAAGCSQVNQELEKKARDLEASHRSVKLPESRRGIGGLT